MKKTLGQKEAQLLAYCHMRGVETVQTDDFTGPLRITARWVPPLALFALSR
jgi:hypothetical protein